MFTEKELEVGDAAGRAEMHAAASSRTRKGNASTKFEFRGSIALKLRIARSRWELAKNGVFGNYDRTCRKADFAGTSTKVTKGKLLQPLDQTVKCIQYLKSRISRPLLAAMVAVPVAKYPLLGERVKSRILNQK